MYLTYYFTYLGFEVEDATDDGVEYLVKKHPEILMFQLGNEWKWNTRIKLTLTGLNGILSLPSLSSLIIVRFEFISGINVNLVSKQLHTLQLTDYSTLNNDWFLQILEQCGSTLKTLSLVGFNLTDEMLIKYKGTLPCLENLDMGCCRHLTNKGLLLMLQLCGTTLRSLDDISGTDISGENLSEYKGTLPCLEKLNMRDCDYLTDNGLLQFLQLCGSTLRSLIISGTDITGENLSEYKGTLPCLENLDMRYCQLTDRELVQIFKLCGSTLRSLDLSDTNITGENLSEYKGTLPCLENLELSYCHQLTDRGLVQIFQLCGSTLRSLDISYTRITGENLPEDKGTLPLLENLNMHDCRHLTNKGLLQIRQLCGSTLRSLDISGTNRTGENLSKYSHIRISFLIGLIGVLMFLYHMHT